MYGSPRLARCIVQFALRQIFKTPPPSVWDFSYSGKIPLFLAIKMLNIPLLRSQILIVEIQWVQKEVTILSNVINVET